MAMGNIARMDPKLNSKCRNVSWPSPSLTRNQCATGNPVPDPVDPVDFFRSGSGPVPTKYRPDLTTCKFGCKI